MAEQEKKKLPVFKIVLGLAVAFFGILVLTGQKTWYSTEPPIQIIDDMDNQFKVKPQVGGTFFADRSGTRTPLENTVPTTGKGYPFEKPDILDETKKPLIESMYGVNPLPENDFVMARGKNRFEAFCSPCHNIDGQGNGTVVRKGFQNPPNLRDELTKSKTDAHLFHIISVGQNLMPGYGYQLPEKDRWTVVRYIRHLQSLGVEVQK